MKILYDHQIFQHQRIGGVSRYFVEIIKHLPENVIAEVAIEYSFNEYLKDTDIPFRFEKELDNKIWREKRFKGQMFLSNLREKLLSGKYPNRLAINKEKAIQKIKQGDFDIFHPTFFEDYYLDIMGKKPYVLTVHDMILELYPEFTYSIGFVQRKKKLIDRAAHIIAVSENTKKDLVDIFNVAPEKISVTYHASSLTVTEDSDIKLPSKYILFIGDRRMGYKNFAFFITSVVPILKKYPDVYIFCVGSPFTENELNLLNAFQIKGQVIQKFVADKDLYTVYNKAQMFVYPSYYEGFGIPIVEAFQAKCPIILADASCFREVAGDAALYFSPKSPNQLRDNIVSFLDNAGKRIEYIEKGTKQLQKYSWKKSAKSTVEVYKKVLNN